MPTRVYDIDGTERSLEWLSQTWDGCEVLPAKIPAGVTEYWHLEEVHCTTGTIVVTVSARRGNLPAVSQPVVMTYPNLADPSHELPTLSPSPNNWAPRGDVKRTNSNGLYEYELGSTFGPFYHAWVFSSVPSDCLSKTGMMGGTNHHGPLHGVWVLTPTAPVYATLGEAVIGACDAAQVIRFNPAAALQKAIFAAGFVPNSPEVGVIHGGIGYRAQRAEHLGTSEVRAYYCRLDYWDDVRYVVRP